MSEFDMALRIALRYWPGTSMVEGAYEIMGQMQAQHREPSE